MEAYNNIEELEKFNNFTQAEEAAEKWFNEHFGHECGVGIESQKGNVYEFYSKDDPGSDFIFYCVIEK